MKTTLIEMKDIVKRYQMGQHQLTVLNDVSITVEAGEFVAILGPSGSGKSTLMNLVGCIDTPTTGTLLLDGNIIQDKSDDELAYIRNQVVGFIFQKFNLLPKYTALHNVAFPLFLRGMSKKEAYPKAFEMLEKVGLGDRTNHKPMELSGGQQQRVSVARALVGDPKLLLADEPTGSLDSASGEEIMNLFLELNRDGNTIVLITHDRHIAQKAHRIISVKDGQIISDEINDKKTLIRNIQ